MMLGYTKMISITLVYCCSTLCHTWFEEHEVMERNFAVQTTKRATEEKELEFQIICNLLLVKKCHP